MEWQCFHDVLLRYLALQMFGFIVMALLEVASSLSPVCCGVILYSDRLDHVQQVCVRVCKRVFPWMASPPPSKKVSTGTTPTSFVILQRINGEKH